MAQNPHEYLIEQLQFTGDESVGSSSNKIKLNFNHPVKELIWVVQPDENVDYCASFVCGECLNGVFGAQPFNYTDAVDALPNAYHAFGSLRSLTGTGAARIIEDDGAINVGSGQDEFLETCAFEAAGASYNAPGGSDRLAVDELGHVPFGGPKGNNLGINANDTGLGQIDFGSSVSDAGTFVLAQTALDLHCWGQNPVVTAKLQLNGQDRFSEREGTYFDLVQPYQHHTRNPDTGINVYSFALRPEEHQPSGSCNFSRIDNATLQLVLSNATVSGTKTAKVRVYATNYNVLRVMSGMGGLAYSN